MDIAQVNVIVDMCKEGHSLNILHKVELKQPQIGSNYHAVTTGLQQYAGNVIFHVVYTCTN